MPQQDDILQGPFTKYLTEPAHQAAPINPSGYMGNTGAVAFIADKFLAGASQARRRAFEQQEFQRARNESVLNSALQQVEKRTDLLPEVKSRLMSEIARYKVEQVAGTDTGGSGGKKQGGNPIFDFVKGMASNMVGGPVKKAKPIDDAALGRLFQELENPENTIPFQVQTATEKANQAIDSIVGGRQPGFVSLQEVVQDPRFQEAVTPFTKYTDGKLPPPLAMKLQSYFPSADPTSLQGLIQGRMRAMAAAQQGLNPDGSRPQVEQQLPTGMIGEGLITSAPPNQASPALMPVVNTSPPPGTPTPAAGGQPGATGQPQVDAFVSSAIRKQFGAELESVNALIDGKQVRVLREKSTGLLYDPVSNQPLPPDQQRAATGTTVFNPASRAAANRIVLENRAGAGGRPERVWVDRSQIDPATGMPKELGKFGDAAVEIGHRVITDEAGNQYLVPVAPGFVSPSGGGPSALPSTTPPPAPPTAKPSRKSPPGTPVNGNPWAKARETAKSTAAPAAGSSVPKGAILVRPAPKIDQATIDLVASGAYASEDIGPSLGLPANRREFAIRQMSEAGIRPFTRKEIDNAKRLAGVTPLLDQMHQLVKIMKEKGRTAVMSPDYLELSKRIDGQLGTLARFAGGERSAVLSNQDIERMRGIRPTGGWNVIDAKYAEERLNMLRDIYARGVRELSKGRSPEQVKKWMDRYELFDIDATPIPGQQPAMPPELQRLLQNVPGGAGATGAR